MLISRALIRWGLGGSTEAEIDSLKEAAAIAATHSVCLVASLAHLYAAVLCAKGAGRERESKEQLELAVKAHPMRNYASLTALRLLGQERNVPETAEGRSERLRRGSAAGKELLV